MSTRADYYLCFPDEAASFGVALALDAVAMTDDGPRLVRYTHRYALDVIGTIRRPTGETTTTADGYVLPILEDLPGWHVNFGILDGSPLPEACAPYVVSPAHPARVWAE